MATGDLCAVEDVQAYLSLPAGQDAVLLQNLISNCSAFVLGYLNRKYFSATYTEKRNGHGGSVLALKEYPITAVTSVVVDNVAVLAAIPGQCSGFVFDDHFVYLLGDQVFCRGAQNVTIVYTGGRTTVPLDIAQATIEMVATKYKRRTNIEVSAKTLGGETISFTMADMPASAKAALVGHVRVFQQP